MQIVETTVTAEVVKVTLANNSDKETATERLHLEFPTARNEGQFLGDIHQGALRRARDAIDAEIQRLEVLAGPRSAEYRRG
jgi:hypothetical protein